jgi:hypothetical protein
MSLMSIECVRALQAWSSGYQHNSLGGLEGAEGQIKIFSLLVWNPCPYGTHRAPSQGSRESLWLIS